MNKIPKRLRKELLTWLLSGTALLVFLVATQPLDLPLPVLLVPFGLFWLWCRSAVILVGLVVRKQSRASRKIRVVAASVASVLLLIVTLQSLGQLSWRDMLLILSLIVFLAFYFYKTDLI